MVGELLFYGCLIVSLGIGFLYFRDLGDLTQMVIKVKRTNMLRFIRHEYLLVGTGLGAAAIMMLTYLATDAGSPWLLWPALLLILFLYGFTWVYVHLGLRQQRETARYFSVDQALRVLAPGVPVLVVENNGTARAHPDCELLRPHLAGNPAGLGGENVIMTYCAMANLGLGYIPEIKGQACALNVLAQHGNNLIMRDNVTREPIQQIYGYREKDGPNSSMQPWPTFRMTLRTFAKAYPDGEVFLNPPEGNALLRLFDMLMAMAFSAGIADQHNYAAPKMDNMTRVDERLPTKTYVWGINIGDDAVAFTKEYVVGQGGLVHTTVGGRSIALAWNPEYESLGAWYNESGQRISEINVFGQSDRGQLSRVEVLKPGMFWHVWAEFFPDTDINRGT